MGQVFLGDKLSIPNDTQSFYSPAAVSLSRGEGYLVQGKFSNRYPPGYPVFIALIYGLTQNDSLLNPVYPYAVVLLQSLSCGFLYLVSAFIFGSAVGILSSLLLATYPFFMVLSMTRYVWTSMPFFIFTFLAALYSFLLSLDSKKPIFAGVSGFLSGLSALIWPAAIYSWIAYILVFIAKPLSGKSIKIIVFLVSFFIPVSFWSLHVYKHTQRTEITSGTMLSVRDGLIRNDGYKLNSFEVSQDAKIVYDAGGLRSLKHVGKFYWDELRHKPLSTVKFLAFKCFRPWYATDSEKNELIIIMIQIPYLLLGVMGWLRMKARNPAVFYLFGVMILYFWLMASAVLSILRYMLIPMSLIMISVAFLIKGKQESIK